MIYTSVQNGTHAGWRRINPAPTAWKCECGSDNAAHWAKCPTCKAPRP